MVSVAGLGDVGDCFHTGTNICFYSGKTLAQGEEYVILASCMLI